MNKNWVIYIVLGFIVCFYLHKKAYSQANIVSDGVRIAWGYSSMQQIAERGSYPRLIRLKDSTILTIYETRTGNIHLKKSKDNGKTWSAPEEVFSKFIYASLDGKSTVVNIANPEVKQLQNGDIVVACNYRPQQAEIAPYSIVIRRSVDDGKTWLPPQTLYVAAPRFGDGCWEPSFLQLPNGELQVYFANENPYQRSDEQEISMVKSLDNGKTWNKENITVSFRKDRRDGMPVPILMNDEIVLAIEDNKTDRFKPYTVRTSVANNWKSPVLADSKSRDYALDVHIPDSVYIGAPYLLKLPGGQTLLSYQTNESRLHDWEFSTMEVVIGDENARNFGNPTRPFDVPLDKEAKWNSLALWDNQTVVALASTNFKSKNVAPWLIKGSIVPNVLVAKTEIEEFPIFVGSKSNTNIAAGIAEKNQEILIRFNVTEKSTPLSDKNGTYLFFYLEGKKHRIWSSRNGKNQISIEKNGQWKPIPNFVKIKTEINMDGYNVYYTIPYKKQLKSFQIGLALSSYKDNGEHYIEYLANMNEDNTSSWIKVVL